MKAAMLKQWNDLELTDIDMPVCGLDEALIKVLYGGVCGSDITVYRGQHMTATAPVVLCHEILGVIESLPEGYEGGFKIGERVLMNPVIECGTCRACKSGFPNVCSHLKLLGIHENGGFAQYTKVRTKRLVHVDASLPDEIAALGEPFAVAYHVTSRSGVGKGDKALIVGAGIIGLVVALAARERGAEKVMFSEVNEDRLKLVRALGFEAINPLKEDLMGRMKDETDGDGFDVVYEVSGSKAGVMQLPDLCRPHGTILSLSLSGLPYEFPIGKVSFKELTLVGSRLYSQEDFEKGVEMLSVMAQRHDLRQLISDIMPLSEIIPAIELMKSGKNLGKILIRCN